MILLLGATGYTGRLVARELARAELPFAMAGRDAGRLAALRSELGVQAEARVASATDPGSLRRALEGARVVVNTVGPFTELGEPVVQAALDAGCHYLDTTGEQAFIRRIRDRFHDRALSAGRAVIPACAFEFAVGGCAAAMALAGFADRARSVDVYYASSGAGASRGTAKSILRIAGAPMLVWEGGREVRRRAGQLRDEIAIDGHVRSVVGIPGGEALDVPRWADVVDVRTWLALPRGAVRALRVASPLLPVLRSRTVRRLADAAIDRLVTEPTDEQRGRGGFTVVARVRADGLERRCDVTGVDGYAVTARLIVQGARRLLQGPACAGGVVGPEVAFDPARLLDDVGLEWAVTSMSGGGGHG